MDENTKNYLKIIDNRSLPTLFKLMSGIFSGDYKLKESRVSSETVNNEVIGHFKFDVKKSSHSKVGRH